MYNTKRWPQNLILSRAHITFISPEIYVYMLSTPVEVLHTYVLKRTRMNIKK